MNASSEIKIDLRQMILALETMVDLVGMNDTDHGKRVGYIASQLAHRLGFSEQLIQFSFELGLLHDCGVSTEQMHCNLVNHFDWEGADAHCGIGYRLLKNFEPLAMFAKPIRYHHTKWNELYKLNISREDAQMANLIFLADRIDTLASTHYNNDILLARKEILKAIQAYSGSYFDPLYVDAFIEIERSEAFWISLEDRHITRFTWDMGLFQHKTPLNVHQLKQMSLIMAYIVDQKSPFTAQHSTRVGCLARYLAALSNLTDEHCEKIEIAGFLHDIGKLRMPDNILEKPGPLSDVERAIMSQHSYETYEILRHIEGLDEIALWAAYHHEDINGTGYPFHPSEGTLSIEARIIAVADVFQALLQNRPYRESIPLSKVLEILDNYVVTGKLDKTVVAWVKQHAEKCFEIANGLAEENKESEIPFFKPGDSMHEP